MIPGSVESIGDCAFNDCLSLASIAILDGVVNIGDSAFGGCSITSIQIPDSVTSIGEGVFTACVNLMSITVSNGNPVYCSQDSCLIEIRTNTLVAGCKTSIIPEGVTKIANNAFHSCEGVTSIVIPDGVTRIGSFAFYFCTGLTGIVIPDSVTAIGDFSFTYCEGLTDVYYTGTEQDWKSMGIESGNDFLLNATIHYNYVPES